MADLLDRAEALSVALTVPDGPTVTCDVRQAVPPCIYINPAPVIDWQTITLDGEVLVVWEIAALAPASDLDGIRALHQMTRQIIDRTPLDGVITSRPRTYQFGPDSPAYPAIITTFEELITP